MEIITEIKNMGEFQELWAKNPGVLIIKFGATWCGPCKQIDPLVKECMSKMPSNIQCVVVDIDDSLELYAFLKKKRVVNGVRLDAATKDNIVDKTRKNVGRFSPSNDA